MGTTKKGTTMRKKGGGDEEGDDHEDADNDEEGDDEEGKEAGDSQGYVGSFALGDGVFTVTTKRDEVEIQIPDGGLEPITRIPGQADAAGSLEDGTSVAVLVEFVLDESSGELVRVARQIIVKPTPQRPIAGAVVSVATDEDGVRILTIMRPDGTTQEVRLGPGDDPPATGDLVTAFQGRGVDGESDRGPPVAKGLVRAEEVRQRLESFLEDLTTTGDLPDEVAERRAQRVTDVAAILESHASKHVEIIERVSQNENLPPQAVQGMQNALERAQRGRDRARGKADEARAKAGRPTDRGNEAQGGQGQSDQGDRGGQGQSDQEWTK